VKKLSGKFDPAKMQEYAQTAMDFVGKINAVAK